MTDSSSPGSTAPKKDSDSLRHVEKDVLIPKKMRTKAMILCQDLVKGDQLQLCVKIVLIYCLCVFKHFLFHAMQNLRIAFEVAQCLLSGSVGKRTATCRTV